MIVSPAFILATTMLAGSHAFSPEKSVAPRSKLFSSYLDSLHSQPSLEFSSYDAPKNDPERSVVPKLKQFSSYLDSLHTQTPSEFSAYDAPQNDAPQDDSHPSSFGEMAECGIDDACALEAASAEIKAIVAKSGSISASEIYDSIKKANDIAAMVQYHFPGSMGSSEILKRVKNVLESYGADNVLLTQSVCPDEINHEHGDITDLFIENIGGGKVFHLGGLAGVPFSGRTGFGAYSAHVEDNGHAFVLQAPHIGISNDLKLGQYSREGQALNGAACGAAVGAMCHCASGQPLPDLNVPDDYQMNFLTHEISKCMPAIAQYDDEDEKQAELARQTHRIGKEMLDNILSTNFGDDNSLLFVLTGIQINMPFEFEDYFQPLSFEVRRKDGTIVDLFWTLYLNDCRPVMDLLS